MRANRSFIEEELDRERRLDERAGGKFIAILEHIKKIFGINHDSYANTGREISAAISASKYGIIYPTICDKPQTVYANRELTDDEVYKYLNTIIIRTK